MNDSTSGHYVKGSGRGSLPGRFVVIIVTTDRADRNSRTVGAHPARHLRTVAAHCQRRGSGYSAPTLHHFSEPSAVWEWLESPRLSGRRTNVLAPVASDSLTHLRFWDRLIEHGCRWRGSTVMGVDPQPSTPNPHPYSISKRVLAGTPDILEYQVSDRRFVWCSLRNYYRDSERAVAGATGYRWRTAAEGDDSDDVVSATPEDHARMWLHAVTSLACWWRDRKAGRWPMTLAGMGYQYLRSRIPPKSVVTHKDDEVIKLERLCCHGGRATLWFVGDVRPRGRHTKPADLPYPSGGEACIAGPIHHVDVRSMYPSLMRDKDFPVKLYKQEGDISPKRLREWLDVYHAIARVTLDTEAAEYPHRRGDRIIYPTGRFTAHLTTPELIRALDEGSVSRVHHVALYYRGRPFRQAAIELLYMRAESESKGDVAGAKWVKALANSCTGKLAQRKYDWIPRLNIKPYQTWGSWYDLDSRSGKVTCYRAMAGLVEERTDSGGGTGTLTAAYAVLTAYGRVMMRRIRELLPPRTVISQDTDGMWVSDAGYSQITREHGLIGESAGLLRQVQSVSSARFWTPQHYTAGGSWTLAGFSADGPLPGSLSFEDASSVNPIRTAPLGPPSETIEVVTHKTLDSNKCDGVHGEDGWMTPYRLPHVAPTKHQPPPPESDLFG